MPQKCQKTFQKMNADEEVITELKEKMQKLKFRVLDCQNHNQMLKKELLLAKKVVDKELVAGNPFDFDEVLKQSTASDFRGRKEKAMNLRNQIVELQKQIEELESEAFEEPPSCCMKRQVAEEKFNPKVNKDWLQLAGKELNYLLENSAGIKRKIEIWRKRNDELKKEAGVLRLEIERMAQKGRCDQEVHQEYPKVERELRDRQAEKLDLRSKLDTSKTRNKLLVEEVAMLKDDLSDVMSKTNDDKTLIEALTNQQAYLQDLVERQKMISESDTQRFKEDLRQLMAKHTTSITLLNQLQEAIREKGVLKEELQIPTPLVNYAGEDDEEKEAQTASAQALVTEQSVAEVPEEAPPAENVENSNGQNATQEQLDELLELKDEWSIYRSLFLTAKNEADQLIANALSNSDSFVEWMSKLIQTRSLYCLKAAEVRNLQETEKRLKKSSKKKNSVSSEYTRSFVEEISILSDVLTEEHRYLYQLWQLMSSGAPSIVQMYTSVEDRLEKLFVDDLKDLKKSLTTIPLEDNAIPEGPKE